MEEPQFCRYVRMMYVLRISDGIFSMVSIWYFHARNCSLRYKKEGYILICTLKHLVWYLLNRNILPFLKGWKIILKDYFFLTIFEVFSQDELFQFVLFQT